MKIENIDDVFIELISQRKYIDAWLLLKKSENYLKLDSNINKELYFNIIKEMIHWGDITAVKLILSFEIDLNFLTYGRGIFNEIIDAYYHKQDELAIIILIKLFKEGGLKFDYSVDMGLYPFQWCVARGYELVLQYFLSEGMISNINQLSVDADIPKTALRFAFELEEYSAARILIEHGADPCIDIVGYDFFNGLYFDNSKQFMDYIAKMSKDDYLRLPQEWNL